jgi:hypothetical protein
MKIHYTVTLEDLIEFNKHHAETSPSMNRMRGLMLWGGSAALIVIGAIQAIALHDKHEIARWAFAVVFYFFFTKLFYTRFRNRLIRNMYKENAGRGMVGRQELEMTETDLVTRSEKGSQSTRLSAIQRIVESPTHYFIYTSALGAYVVRKSAVEGDLPGFIATMRSKCPRATA